MSIFVIGHQGIIQTGVLPIHNNSARDMHFICIDWTLWGLSTHIDQRVVICSDDGLSAGKTLFDTNLVSIVLLGIKFIEMLFEMQTFVLKKKHEMKYKKCRLPNGGHFFTPQI